MPQVALQPMPLKTAADRLKAKTVVASTLRSADWSQAPQQIRDAGFFSSRVACGGLSISQHSTSNPLPWIADIMFL